MSKEAIGIAFFLVIAAVMAWWFQSGTRMGMMQKNVVTTNAGGIVPPATPEPSNVVDDGSGWGDVPYYLKANYPSNRGGSGVVPMLSTWQTPQDFNPQWIPPQL